jgi:hypothetical protein
MFPVLDQQGEKVFSFWLDRLKQGAEGVGALVDFELCSLFNQYPS